MPGQWVTRNAVGNLAETYSDGEVLKRLRESNKESPAYDRNAPERWFRIDRKTVVADIGAPVKAVYRWEFDLFEGIRPSARGFSLDLADVARHMGLSIADYLAAPGSATSRARTEFEADRAAAVRAADALLYALRQLDDAGVGWETTADMRRFLTVDNTHELDAAGLLEPTAYARTKGALLAILTRLAHGDEGRATQVYTDVSEHGRTITHVLRAWERRWFEEDYAKHVRPA